MCPGYEGFLKRLAKLGGICRRLCRCFPANKLYNQTDLNSGLKNQLRAELCRTALQWTCPGSFHSVTVSILNKGHRHVWGRAVSPSVHELTAGSWPGAGSRSHWCTLGPRTWWSRRSCAATGTLWVPTSHSCPCTQGSWSPETGQPGWLALTEAEGKWQQGQPSWGALTKAEREDPQGCWFAPHSLSCHWYQQHHAQWITFLAFLSLSILHHQCDNSTYNLTGWWGWTEVVLGILEPFVAQQVPQINR